jgi:hypothetical protein
VVQLIVSTLGHHHSDSQLLDDCLYVAAIGCHIEVVYLKSAAQTTLLYDQ